MNRLAKYQPISPLGSLWDSIFGALNSFEDSGLSLLTKTRRTDDGLQLTVPLPGVEKDQITVEVIDRYLRITAHSENLYYNQMFSLPANTRIEQLSAESKNGLLTINVPVQKPSTTKVEIK